MLIMMILSESSSRVSAIGLGLGGLGRFGGFGYPFGLYRGFYGYPYGLYGYGGYPFLYG